MLLAALLPAASGAARDEPEQVARELDALRERIGAIEQELTRSRRERDATVAELARIEKAIAGVTRRIEETRRQLAAAERRLTGLEAEEQTLEAALAGQRQGLAGQLRTAYALGRQSRLKVWLDQGDPARLGRALAYYRYLNESRIEQIDRVSAQLRRLEQVRTEARDTRSELAALNRTLEAERRTHAENRDQRRQVLASIDARVRDRDQELVEMREQREQLETLLKELQRAFADIPADLSAHAFSERKGRLEWPVVGRFLEPPGQAKSGGMQAAGALIGAAAGAEVRAVSHGRVAYADWLRGFGLIAIVDHGDGFMSLYAFNESLFKDVGDWVETGERLAVIGDSGGRRSPGLYFELRKDGKPLRLADWFAAPSPD